MMVKNDKLTTTGPKYFPMEMCGSDGDETDDNEEEPNPICTLIKSQIIAKSSVETKKIVGVTVDNYKDMTPYNEMVQADQHNVDDEDINAQQPQTYTTHNNTTRQDITTTLHNDHNYTRTLCTQHYSCSHPSCHNSRRIMAKQDDTNCQNQTLQPQQTPRQTNNIINSQASQNHNHDMTQHYIRKAPSPTMPHTTTIITLNRHVLQTPRTTTHKLSGASQHHTIALTCRLGIDFIDFSSLSPRGRSPTPGAIACLEIPEDKHLSKGSLQQTRVCPERLVASEYTGTRASRLIVNGEGTRVTSIVPSHAQCDVGVSHNPSGARTLAVPARSRS